VKVPLGWVLRLRQHPQEDCGRCDVLARAELLWELHSGIVDYVVIDPTRTLACGTNGVYPL
jgi:hypothetical protein